MPGGLLPTMPTLEPALPTPTPTQMTNEKQQRPAHSERASGHWINLVFSIVQSLGHTLPLKLRKPLIVHSMHTGTNSFRLFFRMAGIQVHDSVGAELKPHARTFVSRSRLEPDQFYKDIAEMLEHCRAPGAMALQGGYFCIRLSPRAVQQNVATEPSATGPPVVQRVRSGVQLHQEDGTEDIHMGERRCFCTGRRRGRFGRRSCRGSRRRPAHPWQ